MGLWTNAGLTLVASAVQTAGVACNITYVSISLGCGTISSAITAGTPLTSLTLDANLPVSLSSGQSLTITDGINSETFTTNGTAASGQNVITINSWTPAHNYAAHVSGVCPTPSATDVSLYSEAIRVAANSGAAGASAGESLNAGYFDGTQASGVYMLVGYWGGSTATSTLGTGTLMGEDVVFWNHVLNADSNMYQGDSFV